MTVQKKTAAHDQIAGFVINRFRGDLAFFADGTRWIAARTAKPVFGVLPWLADIRIETEDSVVLENPPPHYGAARDRAYDRLADHFSRHIDTDGLLVACLRHKSAGK